MVDYHAFRRGKRGLCYFGLDDERRPLAERPRHTQWCVNMEGLIQSDFKIPFFRFLFCVLTFYLLHVYVKLRTVVFFDGSTSPTKVIDTTLHYGAIMCNVSLGTWVDEI